MPLFANNNRKRGRSHRIVINGYRLGTAAFSIGTLVWGIQSYRRSGSVDIVVIAYAIGCLYFVDDAFKFFGKWKWSVLHALRLNSYRVGAIAYSFGTIVWAIQSWRNTHAIDTAAALYLIGCIYFLADSFKEGTPPGSRSWLARKIPVTSLELGTVAFLFGTFAWGITDGISIPVAAYGLGCLLFLKDAFTMRTTALAAAVRVDEHERVTASGSSGDGTIRALLFDLDGTLVDSEGQTDAAIEAVLARHDHPNVHLPAHETRGRTWDDIARVLCSQYGLPAEGACAVATELAVEWASTIDAMVPIQGAPKALRDAATHFELAVVSSSPRDLVDRVLAHIGVADIVKVRVGGDDVTKPKPDPEGFLRAATLMGLKPEQCVVFEDSGAGLEAARKANMPSVLVLARCDEPDRCRPLATGLLLHYEAMPPSLWAVLHRTGASVLLDLTA